MSDRDPLQALWSAQPTDVVAMDPAQLRAHASRFQRRIQRRNAIEYIAGAFVIGAFGWYTTLSTNLIFQAGCVLIILGALFVGWKLATTARAASAADALAAESWTAFHRTELVRQRDALRSVWLWYLGPFAPGLILFLAGVALERDLEAPWQARLAVFGLGLLCAGAVFAAIGWINAKAAKKLNGEIDSLDRLSN